MFIAECVPGKDGDLHHALIHRGKAKPAAHIFSGVVLSATIRLTDIMVRALAGVFLIPLTHCRSLKDATAPWNPMSSA